MGLRKVTKAALMLSVMAALPISSAMAAPLRASQSLPAVSAPADSLDGVRAAQDLNGESNQRRGIRRGFLIPLFAVLFAGLGLYFLLRNNDNNLGQTNG